MMSNYRCVTGTGVYTCFTAKEKYCKAPDHTACVSCGTAETTVSLPTNACFPEEGAKCINTGNAGTNCKNLARQISKCELYLTQDPTRPIRRYYACKEYADEGVCDDTNNYMPCRPWRGDL
jgi:hypothetical protein